MHAQTSAELDETVKVAELLYDVNRRLGSVTDYLLKQHGMALSDSEPKSIEVLINALVTQAEEEPSKPAKDGGATATGDDGQPSGPETVAA